MRLRISSLAAWLFLAIALAGRAEWKIVSETNESSAAEGVTHRQILAEDAASGSRATLDLAGFSTRNATLRVVDNPEGSDSLGSAMERDHCLAGVNGGYFDPADKPVGLSLSQGQVIAPLQKARLLSGVVSAAKGRVLIQRAAEFYMKSKPANARQCGPFLVEGAKAIPGLNTTRSARRTFVSTNGNERAALGFCSAVTLAELADLLATPELKIQRALNLDGGSSSGFWFRGAEKITSISERKTVRDYLAIVPR